MGGAASRSARPTQLFWSLKAHARVEPARLPSSTVCSASMLGWMVIVLVRVERISVVTKVEPMHAM